MKLIVTGATGYIGGQLVKRLVAEGHEVGVVVRPESDLQGVDSVTSKIRIHSYHGNYDSLYNALQGAQPEIVIHIASLVLVQHKPEDVAKLVQSNITFPSQLLEAMSELGIRKLINTGTSWQHYGNENYNPVNFYAATKQAFESILAYYVQAHDFEAITLKLFDTYGPGDFRPKILRLLKNILGAESTLDMSGGEQLIDVVHIDDVIEAYMSAIALLIKCDKAVHGSYGVSSGQPISLKELVSIIVEITGQKLSINWGGKTYREREVFEPWKDYKQLPGWKVNVELRDGLREFFSGDSNRK